MYQPTPLPPPHIIVPLQYGEYPAIVVGIGAEGERLEALIKSGWLLVDTSDGVEKTFSLSDISNNEKVEGVSKLGLRCDGSVSCRQRIIFVEREWLARI